MTVDLGFLRFPKNFPLQKVSGHFGQGEHGAKVLSSLQSVGIHTYGELFEYAKRNDFSALPGIGAHTAEKVYKFIQFAESANKDALLSKFLEVTITIANMKDIAEEQLKRKNIDPLYPDSGT